MCFSVCLTERYEVASRFHLHFKFKNLNNIMRLSKFHFSRARFLVALMGFCMLAYIVLRLISDVN